MRVSYAVSVELCLTGVMVMFVLVQLCASLLSGWGSLMLFILGMDVMYALLKGLAAMGVILMLSLEVSALSIWERVLLLMLGLLLSRLFSPRVVWLRCRVCLAWTAETVVVNLTERHREIELSRCVLLWCAGCVLV